MPGSFRNGFTLIELLVVITIIVVLLSLLVPAMDRAMNAAMNAVCMSNLRGIGGAFMFYQGDNNRYMPQGAENAGYWSGTFYDSRLVPYGVAGAYWCPADQSPKYMAGPYGRPRSYGYNNSFIYNATPTSGSLVVGDYTTSGIRATRIKKPASTIVLADRNLAVYVGVLAGGDLWHNINENYDDPGFEANGGGMRRHGGLKQHHRDMWLNYLLADGHVEPIHPIETYALGNGEGSESMWDLE